MCIAERCRITYRGWIERRRHSRLSSLSAEAFRNSVVYSTYLACCRVTFDFSMLLKNRSRRIRHGILTIYVPMDEAQLPIHSRSDSGAGRSIQFRKFAEESVRFAWLQMERTQTIASIGESIGEKSVRLVEKRSTVRELWSISKFHVYASTRLPHYSILPPAIE